MPLSRLRRRFSIRSLVVLNILIGLALGLLGVNPAGVVLSVGIVSVYLIENIALMDLLVMVSLYGVVIGLTLPHSHRTRSPHLKGPWQQPASAAEAQIATAFLADPPRSAFAVGSALNWAVEEISPGLIEAIGDAPR